MKEPNMRARISLLHNTEAGWNARPDFKPFAGEVIVFDPDTQFSYPRIKIGDGKTLLKDLPFSIDSAIVDVLTKTRFNEIIDCGRITDYK